EMAHQIIRLYSFNDMERQIYYTVAPVAGGRPNGVVAGDATAQFCIAGLPTAESFLEAEANLKTLPGSVTVDGCTVDVSWRTLFPAMERIEGSDRLFACVANAAAALGMNPVETWDPCATDAAWISSFGVPAIDALSALEMEIHTMNEHVFIPSIRQRTALAALTILSVAEGFPA
ncbi:MAG: hypothetical protein IJF59_01315, partial [Clostridia bacterium]|nr:hypothetical protein [Clostridia bacterium]